MAILLDLEILFLLSNTRLYVFQRLPKPYIRLFAFVIIMVILLYVLVNIILLLISYVERTILSGNKLARLLRISPILKQTSAKFTNNSTNF